MNVVLVVGPQHCVIVKKTIYYIRKYLKVDSIYIISRFSQLHHFSSRFCTLYNVILLDEDCLVEGLTFDRISKLLKSHIVPQYNVGWYFQQFLKLGFSLTPYAKDNYLVWDADTIPVNEIRLNDNNNYYFNAKNEFHKPYFDTIYRLLGLNKSTDFSFISEYMIFDVNILRDMISSISKIQIKGEKWYEKIISAVDSDQPNGFSEFETYGTYVFNYHKDIYKIQKLKTYRHAGLKYNRLINRKQIAQLSNKGYHTVSLEEGDRPDFPNSVIWLLLRIYVRVLNYLFKLIYD